MVAAAGPLNRFGGGWHLWLATVPVAESPLKGGLPVANEAQPIFFFARGPGTAPEPLDPAPTVQGRGSDRDQIMESRHKRRSYGHLDVVRFHFESFCRPGLHTTPGRPTLHISLGFPYRRMRPRNAAVGCLCY